MMDFKLENPEMSLRGKPRKNIHQETKNRHLKYAMAKIARYLYEMRAVREMEARTAKTWEERDRARGRIDDIDAFEQHLEYEHRRHFRICNRDSLNEIELTIETRGKR